MSSQLKGAEKINAMTINWLQKEPLKIKEDMFQLCKNILLIDNAEHFETEAIELLELLGKEQIDFSCCILTSSSQLVSVFKNRFSSLNLITTQLLPLAPDEIKDYMMKVVKSKSYTDKKDIIESLVDNKQYLKILENPFFLSLYCANLSGLDSATYKPKDNDLTKYSILKDNFLRCTTVHAEEMKEMGLDIKEALPNLRRLAFEYYHNGEEVS
jgi:hypothetical protein